MHIGQSPFGHPLAPCKALFVYQTYFHLLEELISGTGVSSIAAKPTSCEGANY